MSRLSTNENFRGLDLRGLALLFCVALLTGCQTPAWKNFDRVHNGQFKDAVLEEVGGPNITRRVRGQDHWVYYFSDHPDGSLLREVHFEEGRVIYAGPPQPPKIRAEEQDKLNEGADQADREFLSAEQRRRDQRVGASRPPLINPSEGREDIEDRKLRESLYGIEKDINIEKRKRAPVFVPVK